ncbi:MAG: DNA gyrase subunit A [Propionicimonas sp.]|uniref:DNA gyrase subunit A n=1 Tax=Propionicimonas sp. TaxID=1955623 RepID=UPI001DF2AA64|nr:DNA gyrase subunit A [Propionicimonas sp.]MBU4189117.1 DNA gyrase subunit A [Actinomycetota bacterium]MBU4411407.1 DNA gyrase subunit A [Actinomycetota bacterium]MBU4416954.1 DNA gyrase subunit A [Actinomycetota bacterium]MBU4588296.1 DNA gyrase subunit A [Actinomycetota bacterium]MCG2806459.1 DNA gyrase subunit A [Propionicimonas sp.]
MTDGPIEPGETPVEIEASELGLAPTRAKIEEIDLQVEVERSYLDYAMSVIVGRALPDVRDGLKPVHRRVLYAMYDGGYRPDRGWNKCSRVVGEVMGLYHPHGDSAIYATLVRLAQPWVMRAPLVSGQGNFGSPGNDPAAAMRYTECKMAPLSMEMVRDITENTVDFTPNYDNREMEPTVLPARFPNLLVNGSTGIAVGMATNIPTHNLREVASAVQWALDNPEATKEELLEAAMERIKGPDFPSGALIVGRQGIESAYRTGRGSVIMRAVINIEEDKAGRTQLVVTELPHMCNPDNLAVKIAELVNASKLTGIADIRDDSSARTGQRLVILLKRDAQPRVVMNNLYKHTQLQDTFGCNMLALVDSVPRTLRLDQFINYWVKHQIQVIQRRTAYRLDEAEKKAHLDRGLVAALNRLDEVLALIRASRTADAAREGLKDLLGIDDDQALHILNQQLRRLAAMEIQQIIDRLAEVEITIADLKDILARPERQRLIVSTELAEIVAKYGDERRSRIIAADGDMSDEDFIPDDDMVVTITRGGYAKRTRTDLYRTQKRGGKGVRGATLRADDEVDHLFATTNHQWILFFTNLGRVYRAKVWQLPEAGRDAKGGHVAGLLSFLPEERIAEVLTLRTYDDAPYLLLATRAGLVKKTELRAYDSPRQAGVIAINFRAEDDELIGASLCTPSDDVLLISRKGQAIRFQADDTQLRPMGRATSGVTGMKFRSDDSLLSMSVIGADMEEDNRFVFTVTDGGFAKRTRVSEYRQQGRGGLGIKAMKLNEDRGSLVGGLVVTESDEVIAIKSSGQITRSGVAGVPAKGRDTMGVKFVGVVGEDAVAVIALNPETAADEDESDAVDPVVGEQGTVEPEGQAVEPDQPVVEEGNGD